MKIKHVLSDISASRIILYYKIFQFQFTDATAYSYARYGQGSGPIHLSYVACTGTEDALVNCTHFPNYIRYCRHYEDAGVLCQSKFCIIPAE